MNSLNFQLYLSGPTSTEFAAPAPSQQCQVSDGGVDIIVQVLDGVGNPVNLRLATGIKILTVSPSGISTATGAGFLTNGFDGQVVIATGLETPFGAGLNEHGIWSIQCKFSLSDNIQYTTIGVFQVNPNLGV